jgi:hypothetical protein
MPVGGHLPDLVIVLNKSTEAAIHPSAAAALVLQCAAFAAGAPLVLLCNVWLLLQGHRLLLLRLFH